MREMQEFKNGFTQIPNEALEEIFIKGLLSGTEMRIALYIIRQSTGFHREWTNESTVQKIADYMGISRCICSRAINRMIREKKIQRDSGQFKFNENYKSWKVLTNCNALANEKMSTESNGERALIATVVLTNCNGTTSDSTQQINTPETPKYILNKIINKEERNIKERSIFINEKDFKEKEDEKKCHAPAKISFNNQTFKFENIPKEKINKWTEAFNLNVEQELKKMEAWLTANPKNKKVNYERFIVNWLGRAKGGSDGNNKRSISRYVPLSATGDTREKGEANAGEW